MPITLREEVAEAIYKAMPVHTRNWSDIDEPTRADFLCLANAAISIVWNRAEEAGRCAANQCREDGETDLRYVRELVADAILSLANNEPTP